MTWMVYQDTDSEADALLRYADVLVRKMEGLLRDAESGQPGLVPRDVLVESEEIREDLMHYYVRAHNLGRYSEEPSYLRPHRRLCALETALEPYAEPRED